MRFSNVFQLSPAPHVAPVQPAPVPVQEDPAAPVLPVVPVPSQGELPDDLDQRVRMVGEWQLGEG